MTRFSMRLGSEKLSPPVDLVSHRVFSPAGKFPSHCVAVSSLLGTRTLGVPMGGVLPPHNKRTEPPLLSRRSCRPRNPDAPSRPQRLQIIKGWVGQGRQFHRQVIDVAGNADNGASVDPMSCETTGTGLPHSVACGLIQASMPAKTPSITLAPLKIRAAGGLHGNAYYYQRTSGQMAARTLGYLARYRNVDRSNLVRRRCDTQIGSRRTMTFTRFATFGEPVYSPCLGCTSGVTRGSGDRQDCRVVTNGDDSIQEVICR